MKLLILLSLFTSFSSAFANPDSSAPLSTVLAGKGALVFLKALTVSGTYSDGTPAYSMEGNYQSEAGKLYCLAEYSNSSNPDSFAVDVPGADAVFAAGTSISWFTGIAYDDNRFTITDLGDGTVQQDFFLQFSVLGSAKMISMDCSVETPANTVLTVGDFEAATGGLMSLQAQ